MPISQTEFSLAVASPLKLEGELRALPFLLTDVGVYDDGAGGAKIIYARELTNDESQEVVQALALHTVTALLVNYIELVSAPSGEYPYLQVAGPDGSISFALKAKNLGALSFWTTLHDFRNRLGISLLLLSMVDNAVNSLTIEPSITGLPVRFSASGGDASVGIDFAPFGAGRLTENGVPVMTSANPPSMARTFAMMGA